MQFKKIAANMAIVSKANPVRTFKARRMAKECAGSITDKITSPRDLPGAGIKDNCNHLVRYHFNPVAYLYALFK